MMNLPIVERIQRHLSERRAQGLERFTKPFSRFDAIDCSTNSYLDLHQNPSVQAAALALAGTDLAGNTASRLITTRSPLYDELERSLAEWKGTEAALVFTSGYCANVSILTALATRHTDIFCDRLNHASLIDGIKLSGGRLIRYRHGDSDDLAACLARSNARERIIVTDSLFSMDGDAAPLEAICDLAEHYSCLLMVDEAHAAGIYGSRASGLVEALGLENRVAVRMGTLSKAVAGLGGFFAGSLLLRDWLVNQSRGFIYSTALPPSVLAWNLAALSYIRAHPDAGQLLLARSRRFGQRLAEAGFSIGAADSQIIPLLLGDPQRATDCSRYLASKGIRVPAIRPPTVPPGTARLRISVHSGLDDCDEGRIVDVLKTWRKSNP